MSIDDIKQMMIRIQEKTPDEVFNNIKKEMLNVGPESIKFALSFPGMLITPGIRWGVVRLALKMPEKEIIPIFMDALSTTDWRLNQMAKDIFHALGIGATDALVENLKRCKVAWGKVQTLYCLNRLADPYSTLRIGDKTLIPYIIKAVKDQSEEVRNMAIEVLSKSEAFEAEAVIVKCISDNSKTTKLEAIKASRRLRLKKAVPELIKILKNKDPELRAEAIYALDRIGDSEKAIYIRPLLKDKDSYVRWCTVKALKSVWQDENIKALTEAVGDKDTSVAVAALEVIALKAAHKAMGVIEKAAKSKNKSVKNTAEYYRQKVYVTKNIIIDELKRVGLKKGDSVLVHSSLSKLGYVEDGVEKVIDALLETVNAPEQGTVFVPTITGTVKMSKDDPPVFDPINTPCWTGKIPETFRLRVEAKRSLHPSHSIAVIGKLSDYYIKDHENSPTPCGKNTPYWRLAEQNGYILFLGADLRSCIFLHQWGTPRDFTKIEPMLLEKGIMKKGKIGNAEVRLVSAKGLATALLPIMRKNKKYLIK